MLLAINLIFFLGHNCELTFKERELEILRVSLASIAKAKFKF